MPLDRLRCDLSRVLLPRGRAISENEQASARAGYGFDITILRCVSNRRTTGFSSVATDPFTHELRSKGGPLCFATLARRQRDSRGASTHSPLSPFNPSITARRATFYRTVTSATLAEGGRGRNIVPDKLTLNLNHRFTPGTSLEQAQRDILDLVGGEATVEFTDLSPSAPTYATHPLVEALTRSGVSVVEAKQAWTDVARFAQLGVPAVNFGPGVNAQAHQRNEWTSLALLDEGRTIFERWLTSIS
ncbi:MAG: M20/M25/M40 family metallo-hydrolase [Polyangiaceae bacterium]